MIKSSVFKCVIFSVIGLIGTFGIIGCGSPATTPSTENESTAPEANEETAVEIKLPELKELPDLGDSLPALDGERMIARGPKEWTLSPRNDKLYIAMWKIDDRSSYPQLLIRGRASDNLQNLTSDNVKEYLEKRAAEIERPAIDAGIEVQPWIYDERDLKTSSGTLLSVAVLHTLFDGREYEIELRCIRGTLDQFRRHMFAVAHGLKLTPAQEVEATE